MGSIGKITILSSAVLGGITVLMRVIPDLTDHQPAWEGVVLQHRLVDDAGAGLPEARD